MYPIILADMINVVLANEAYLFSADEVALLRSYGELNCEYACCVYAGKGGRS